MRIYCLFFLFYLMKGIQIQKDQNSIQTNFTIIWNVPSLGCVKNFVVDILDFKLPYKGVNILFDHQHQQMNSPFIQTFYENFGVYPRLDYDHETNDFQSVNGGIPQNASFGEHLTQINSQLGSTMNSSLAIIDWESWNPLFDMNFGRMGKAIREASMEWYKKYTTTNQSNNASTNTHKITHMKELFEIFSRKFYEETLHCCRKMGKKTLWGIYGYPHCYRHTVTTNDPIHKCNAKSQHWNNKLMWMYKMMDVLVPSIYLYTPDDNYRLENIRAVLEESIRIRDHLTAVGEGVKNGNGTLAIVPYFRFVYSHNETHLLSKQDTQYLMCQLIDRYNIHQMIIWGSDRDCSRSKQFCQNIRLYLMKTLIPSITQIKSNSKEICNKHHINSTTGNGQQ